jgi:hypothetical protein
MVMFGAEEIRAASAINDLVGEGDEIPLSTAHCVAAIKTA